MHKKVKHTLACVSMCHPAMLPEGTCGGRTSPLSAALTVKGKRDNDKWINVDVKK